MYPRDVLDQIDDKALLAQYVRTLGTADGMIPTTYLTVAEMDADPTDGGLFFLKLSSVDAALGVWCLDSKQAVAEAVELRSLPSGTFVIQREVAAPRLHDGRKCSVRGFVVVWGRTLWLWSEFLVKVHSAPYTLDSTAKAVHVESRGGSKGITALRGTELQTHAADLAEMRRLIKTTFSPWATTLEDSPAWACGQYALVGLDFLFDRNNRGFLIEANCSPCLIDTAAFTNGIKRELARAVCHTFINPKGATPTLLNADFVACT
jgi:hypothetical protein